jgi:hypothetical protein
MSSSRHPIALSVERRVGTPTRLLAVVMCLPLVDGVFVAVVLGGALETVAGIVEVGLLVFAGSATIAVILAEMDATPREQARVVLGVGALVIAGAAVQAALAPTIASAIEMAIFERFAALVVLAVAASTASSRLAEVLPSPLVIVALGLVASLSPSNLSVAVQTDPALIARAVAAAAVGVGAALVVALVSPWLRNAVEIDRFRFGSAVALGVLALSIVGFVPANAPVALAVLAVTALLAFDPGRVREREAMYRPDDIDVTAALSDGGELSENATELDALAVADGLDGLGEHSDEDDEPRVADDSLRESGGPLGAVKDTDTPDRPPWF